MNYKYPRLLTVLVLSLLAASSLFAQTNTSGALEGTVSEAAGVLPGVTVEITSPSMAGTRTAVTNENGRFRFSLLPPGQYTMVATLSGFNSVRQPNINVPLGSIATLAVTMNVAAVSQEITVTAEAPVVDVTSTKTGANVTSEQFESMPIARDFYSVAQVAPGTNDDASGTTFYGSTGAENQYIIDGLNTTGVELGTEAKTLNFDYIQEVEVLTGGLPAEYGRLTGGVINAITKSGGNEFSGDVFGYFASESDNSTTPDRPATTTTLVSTDEEFDYGFDLGGFIVRDRVWFFGAYNRVNETQINTRIQPLPIAGQPTIPAGTEFPTDFERDIYAAKLTFNINPNHTLAASMFGDPTTSDGVQFTIAGPPSTYLGTLDTGGTDFVGRYNGIFGQNFLINALFGQHSEEAINGGPGLDLPLFIDNTVVPAPRTGGPGFFQDQEFNRDVYKLDFTTFLGSHEVKLGGDYEALSAVNANFNSGGQRITKLRSNNGTPNDSTDDFIYYAHRYYLDPDGFVRGDTSTYRIEYPLISEPETNNTSLYVQDSWRIAGNFTLNLGVRLETQEIIGRDGTANIEIDDNFAPRLGFIWDVANNGRSKLYANFGRFHEAVPMDINIRAFGGEIGAIVNNFSPDPANFLQDPTAPRGSIFGGSITPVDPDLEGQYIDEALVGYEYEVSPGLALGFKGTWRDLGQVIEDFLIIDLGNYFIANPGQGVGTEVTMYDYSTAPAPEAKREFTAVEVSARKRFSNNFQFFSSYVWSQLEGNYDGTFQVSTGQLDPNINSAFDYGDFLVNADGPLSNDREHAFKFYGSFLVPGGPLAGLDIGVATYYATGRPLTAMGYSFLYQNWEYYLTPRGSLGRGPDDYEADLHVGYPIRFGNGMQVKLLVDVFNMLDRQAATNVDQRYNLISSGRCGGIPEDICNHDNGILNIPGTTEPSGVLANPRATSPNPDFLQAGTSFTAPRNIRFGVKFSF